MNYPLVKNAHTVVEAHPNNHANQNHDDVPKPKKLLLRPDVKGGPYKGKDAWAGLIKAEPADKTDRNPSGIMEPALKREVVKYGLLCQATYDNFIHFGPGEPLQANPANLLKDKEKLYWIPDDSDVYKYSMEADKTFYLTATSGFYPGEFGFWSSGNQTTNWIGYVAVSEPDSRNNNKRDIAVVFRGTQAKTEWASDFVWEMQPWSDLDTGHDRIKVAKGFETMYRRFASTPGNTLSVQGQVHVAVRKLLREHKDIGTITTTGHSLGGALASLCAFDIAWSQINRVGDAPGGDLIPVTAFTFEAPRVGNAAYANVFEQNYGPSNAPQEGLDHVKYVKMLRVFNRPDIVPRAPRTGFQRRFLLPWRWPQLVFWGAATAVGVLCTGEGEIGYRHGGVPYEVNSLPLEAVGLPEGIRDMRHDFWPCHLQTKIGQFHDLLLALYLIDSDRPIGDLNPEDKGGDVDHPNKNA